GKLFWSAFEGKPLRDETQIQYGKDLASDFETEIFSPLQVLLGVGEGKTEVADGFYVHDRERPTSRKARSRAPRVSGSSIENRQSKIVNFRYTCSLASPRVTVTSIFFFPR